MGIEKSKAITAHKLKIRVDRYNENPTCCKHCNVEFPYKRRHNKFCNSSCAAKYNNPRKGLKSKPKTYCVFCRAELLGKKYCNSVCFNRNQKKTRDTLVESGSASSNQVRNYLIEKYGTACMECGWKNNHPTTGNPVIELEHTDGNSSNNTLTNTKLLCPNCHAMTPTFKALNVGSGRHSRRQRYAENKSF